jgi:hypothetical protein
MIGNDPDGQEDRLPGCSINMTTASRAAIGPDGARQRCRSIDGETRAEATNHGPLIEAVTTRARSAWLYR